MYRLTAIAILATCLLGLGAAGAADDAAPKPLSRAAQLDRDSVQYFAAKANHEALSEADTLNLIKEYGQALWYGLGQYNVDHHIPDTLRGYFPMGDKLDSELNSFDEKFASYTRKDKHMTGAGFYPNPLTSDSIFNYTAVPVPLGWTDAARGNFTYMYQPDDKGHAIHCMLLVYGTKQSQGYDVTGDGKPDGVILQYTDLAPDDYKGHAPWYCNGQPVKRVVVARHTD